jgi:hypothetical protein
MKVIINENQYELLKEMEDKPKVYHFPSLDVFGHEENIDNWNLMQKFLVKKGNPDFTVDGDLGLGEGANSGRYKRPFSITASSGRNVRAACAR